MKKKYLKNKIGHSLNRKVTLTRAAVKFQHGQGHQHHLLRMIVRPDQIYDKAKSPVKVPNEVPQNYKLRLRDFQIT